MAILKIFDETAYQGAGDSMQRRRTYHFGQYSADFVYGVTTDRETMAELERMTVEKLLQMVEKGLPRAGEVL